MIFDKGAGLYRSELFLRKLYNRRIKANSDAVIPVVGSEGVGKSTLILHYMLLWRAIARGADWGEFDYDALFEQIHSTRRDVRRAMINQTKGSVIAVPDAGRVLYRKEAMVGEQRDLEKDFFDVRNRNYVFFLGFQDWKQLPDFLGSRRATHCIYVPRRGKLWGYARSTLDERVGEGRGLNSWPDPDLEDSFPSLEGTDLWEEYTEFDKEEKLDRMGGGEEEIEPEEVHRREQQKFVISLRENTGMSARDIANQYRAVDYSKSWVNDVIRDWKDGAIDPFGQTEEENRVT